MADYTQLMNLEKKTPAPTFPPRNDAKPNTEPQIASLLAKKQTDKEANQQVNKSAKKQVSKLLYQQISKPASH